MSKYHNISCSKCNDYRRLEVTDEILDKAEMKILDESEVEGFDGETKKIIDGKEVNVIGFQTMECPKCKIEMFNVITDIHPNMVIPDFAWNAL